MISSLKHVAILWHAVMKTNWLTIWPRTKWNEFFLIIIIIILLFVRDLFAEITGSDTQVNPILMYNLMISDRLVIYFGVDYRNLH